MTATTQPLRRGTRFRFAPALIVVLFLAPMVAAWVAFKYFPEQMRALGTTNYGSFIDPPREVTAKGLVALDGSTLGADVFRDKWTYLYIDGSECDDRCQASLYEMRQVRLTQGPEMDRLQRVFVVKDSEHLEQLRERMKRDFPQQRTAVADAEALRALDRSLRIGDVREPLSAGRIYVIDPLGRAMMFYEPVASPDQSKLLANATGMRKDMTKLLKNSKTQ